MQGGVFLEGDQLGFSGFSNFEPIRPHLCEFALSPVPKLLISYSHDSRRHEDRVHRLADRLNADGFDTWIDQYSPAPSDGWRSWMETQIRNADFVLLVCTDTYLRRVRKRDDSARSRGVLWEASLIHNLLYAGDKHIEKLIPILFDETLQPSIPPYSNAMHYQVDSAGGLEDLYRHITDQPRFQVPLLQKLCPLPPKLPASITSFVGR